MKRTRNCLRNNLYFLGKVVQIAPLYLFLSASLRVMMGVRTSYTNVYFLAYVISCVEEGKPLIHVLLFIAVSFGAVSITYGLQAAFENLYQPVSLEKIQQELQHTIFQKARLTDLEVYDSEEYYTSVILANSESSNRVLAVLENLLNLMETVVTIAMIVGYSLTMDWIVPVVAILSFTISFLMNQYIARLRVEYDNDLQQVNKETSMLHRILYLPDFAKDIRLTGIRDGMLRLYRKANKVKDALIRRKGKKIGFVAALEIILSGAVCIDFLVPLYLVCRILIQKTLVASQFVAIVNGCNQLQLKLEDLAKEIGVFYQNGEFIQRYRRVEFRPNKIESSVGLEEESSPPAFRELALHNVSFQYPSGGFALKDINGKRKYQQAAAYILRLNTGLRTGELLGLLNSDIDLERRVLHLERGVKEVWWRDGLQAEPGRDVKVGKLKSATSKRTVPLNDTAIAMIQDLRQEAYFGENTPLVPDEHGNFTRPVNFRKRYYRILAATGIEKKGLHSLRHTFASSLVNGIKQADGTIKSLTPRQVADLLGHSTSQITELYYVKKDTSRLHGITDGFNL